jgi:hypothetical protein
MTTLLPLSATAAAAAVRCNVNLLHHLKRSLTHSLLKVVYGLVFSIYSSSSSSSIPLTIASSIRYLVVFISL